MRDEKREREREFGSQVFGVCWFGRELVLKHGVL